MKNNFSLSSQQMQQKLCLCQHVIQYDRSESTESNSWWNLYTYSIYSLEMWRPSFVWSSRHPQHTGSGFKLPKRNHCLWTQVTIQSWRAPDAHSEPRPQFWVLQKEVNSRAPKWLWQPNQSVGSGDKRGISKLHKLHCCQRCSWSHPQREHIFQDVQPHTMLLTLAEWAFTNELCCSVPSGTRWQNCYQHLEQ